MVFKVALDLVHYWRWLHLLNLTDVRSNCPKKSTLTLSTKKLIKNFFINQNLSRHCFNKIYKSNIISSNIIFKHFYFEYLQMLNKPPEPSDMMGQAHHSTATQPTQVPQDLVYKFLQAQEVRQKIFFIFIIKFV